MESSSSSLSLSESGCLSQKSSIEMESSSLITSRYQEIEKFLIDYNYNVHYRYEIYPEFLSSEKSTSSALNPLVFSEASLKEQLELFDTDWAHAVGADYWFKFLAGEPSFEGIEQSADVREMKKLVAKIKALVSYGERWNSLQCNLSELASRKDKDIRPLIEFQTFKDIYCGLGECPEQVAKKEEEQLLELCEGVSNESSCAQEFSLHKKKETLHEFENHYHDIYQKRFDSFFELTVRNQWKCEERNGRIVMTIPYYVDDKFEERSGYNMRRFEQFVEDRWRGSGLQVKLSRKESSSSDVVTVNWSDSTVSFVDYDHPKVINLSKHLSNKKLMLIFAHELGHVLGFPDCYLEFYDSQEEEVIYYNVDPFEKNIMCDAQFNSLVPEDYMSRLKDQACSES